MHEINKIVHRAVGLVDETEQRVAQLSQIVRRNIGGHAHGNAGRTVEQEVRHLGGQDLRLLFRAVVVRAEIHGLLFNVVQKLGSQAGHAHFGISHGGGGVAVDGAEVALSVFQRIAHVEILRHAHEGIVHGRIAVGMILAYDVADDTGAFLGGPVVGVGHLRLREENAAMHGLESVARIGNGTAYDDAERIGQIGLTQLFFYIDFEFCHGRNPLGNILRNVP